MAMVRDLQERANELAAHDIVAAIAGDNEARTSVSSLQQDLSPNELDRIPPENEFIVLDADSSQPCAIADVVSGQHAVIHAPPGTGKSRTLANLVATLAATRNNALSLLQSIIGMVCVRR
jgi:replication-associated recombination protein RarA